MAGDNVISLDLEKAHKFLDALAEDPFLCIVVTNDGDNPQVQIFSKGLDSEHVARIKQTLQAIEKE